jgi:hypothetical protein
LNKLPLRPPTEEEINLPSNLEATHQSAFIPRSVLLIAIRERFVDGEYQSMLSLLEKYESRLFTSIIQLANASLIQDHSQ